MAELIKAVIFDLDGVITDTAEYHYRAWKRLADEEGLAFTREDNEALRGVPRRESLLRLLKGQPVSEAAMQAMMDRKNAYYQDLLNQITPTDLLPGVSSLLSQLDTAAIPYAVASASHNAGTVIDRLGLRDRLGALVDGSSVTRQKPFPDLFRYAAALLDRAPFECLVVEDAAAGIEAALAAGMPCLALGPAQRFVEVERQFGPVPRREDLSNIRLEELHAAARLNPGWHIIQARFEPEHQHHMETVFTTGNGYFCSRGSFEEGHPDDHALTLAHGVFDDMPISITELANLPGWLDLTIRIDGATFRLDQGQVLSFRRYLDLRHAILRRDVRWQSPQGVVVDLTFERFASYAHEHVGALRVLITAVSQPCQIEVNTGIDGHVANGDLLHWRHLDQGEADGAIWLHSRTRHSGIELGAAAAVTASRGLPPEYQLCPGQPAAVIRETLGRYETLQVDKLVSYAFSCDRVEGPAAVVQRALLELNNLTYNELRAAQTAAWDALWADCDMVIEGDAEAQLAIRFHLFQLLIAAAQRNDRVSIGAKTLSGLGYRGHVFWDTEIFILPFFIYTRPDLARNMLMYRYHTLPGARRKAAANEFEGAQYAWESAATGDEVTPTWVPSFDGKELVRIWTGDIEIHITADIAYAILQYWSVTGDDAFMRDYGAEIVLDTARFWGSRAELEEQDGCRRYALRDVIGPDEYHDHVDNNVFTNRMAQWHLQTALKVLAWLDARHPDQAAALRQRLDLTETRLEHWRDVIAHIIINHDLETGLMVQFDGFFERTYIDPQIIADTDRSMQVVLGIEGANDSQVIKQADVIMLLCLFRDAYDHKTWQKNWDTYMPITDHKYGSSLGPSFHAWAACEMSRPNEAYQHFMLAAQADLYDVRGNAGDGIHAASAGGLWQAVAFGFAGLRIGEHGPSIRPCFPDHWQRVAFGYIYQGERRAVDIVKEGGGYRIVSE